MSSFSRLTYIFSFYEMCCINQTTSSFGTPYSSNVFPLSKSVVFDFSFLTCLFPVSLTVVLINDSVILSFPFRHLFLDNNNNNNNVNQNEIDFNAYIGPSRVLHNQYHTIALSFLEL